MGAGLVLRSNASAAVALRLGLHGPGLPPRQSEAAHHPRHGLRAHRLVEALRHGWRGCGAEAVGGAGGVVRPEVGPCRSARGPGRRCLRAPPASRGPRSGAAARIGAGATGSARCSRTPSSPTSVPGALSPPARPGGRRGSRGCRSARARATGGRPMRGAAGSWCAPALARPGRCRPRPLGAVRAPAPGPSNAMPPGACSTARLGRRARGRAAASARAQPRPSAPLGWPP